MSLTDAFNSLLGLTKRSVTILRPGGTSKTIYISASNYSRNLQGPSDMAIKGREFVASKKTFDDVSFGEPKRGDRITDTVMGNMTIVEVTEMFGLQGELLGYRFRVG